MAGAETRVLDVYDTIESAMTTTGDMVKYWPRQDVDGHATTHHGDCFEILREISFIFTRRTRRGLSTPEIGTPARRVRRYCSHV